MCLKFTQHPPVRSLSNPSAIYVSSKCLIKKKVWINYVSQMIYLARNSCWVLLCLGFSWCLLLSRLLLGFQHLSLDLWGEEILSSCSQGQWWLYATFKLLLLQGYAWGWHGVLPSWHMGWVWALSSNSSEDSSSVLCAWSSCCNDSISRVRQRAPTPR